MNRLLATLLAASLAVNLWLGWKWAATSAEKEILSRGPAAIAPHSVVPAISPSLGWRELAMLEPEELRQKLVDDGVPTEIIRPILRKRLRDKYRAEWDASAVPNTPLSEWWRLGIPNPTPEQQQRHAARGGLNGRIETEIDALLGEQKPVRRDDPRYWFLSPEKAEGVRQVTADYETLRTAYASDPAKLALLEAEQRRDLAGLLSAEDLAEYELRFAPQVDQLRYRAARTDVSEVEFRRLIGLQQQLDSNMRTAKSFAERVALDVDYEARIFQTLGAERAPDFLWGGNGDYTSVKLALRAQQLPVQSAADLMRLQRDISARAFVIASDSEVTIEAKRAALRDLASEARTALTRFTPTGFLFPSNSVAWIDQLERGSVWHNFWGNISGVGRTVGP